MTSRRYHTWTMCPSAVASRFLCGVAVAMLLLSSTVVVAPPAEAAFPGRNGRIVFTVNQIREPTGLVPGGLDWDLFTVSPAGHDVRRVTGSRESDDYFPAWSPDGRRIAFARITLGAYSPGTGDIYVTDATGHETTNLTASPDYWDGHPSWSPDGTKIVFSSAHLAFADIYVMDADGGNVTHLTSGTNPVWSPQGDVIAFVDSAATAVGPIRLIRTDGARVAGDPLGNGAWPSWSPDGRRIAFESRGDIFVVERDGSHLRNLTGAHGSSRDMTPAWSPDGRWIAFVSDREGETKLFKMRPDGSGVTRIVDLTLTAEPLGIDWGRRP